MLTKFGAVRTRNAKWKWFTACQLNWVYQLPPVIEESGAGYRLQRCSCRDSYHPGAAQLIARLLDSLGKAEGIWAPSLAMTPSLLPLLTVSPQRAVRSDFRAVRPGALISAPRFWRRGKCCFCLSPPAFPCVHLTNSAVLLRHIIHTMNTYVKKHIMQNSLSN